VVKSAPVSADFPVFIGGANRSGTSLVRQLVGSHPEIALPQTEFEFFKRVAIPRRALSAGELHELVDEILALPKVAAWGLARGPVIRHASTDASARGVFVALLRAYADALRKPRFGDKTTGNERYLRTFDRWFGKRYAFVHVLRHPVPTFASSRWYGRIERSLDPEVWAGEWARSALIALHAARARGDRYVVVRYEDLVRDPERELRRICSCASLEYDGRMVTMADFTERDNSSFDNASASYDGLIRTSDTTDRAAWIPTDELALLKQTCRRAAALVGYDVDDAESVEPLSLGRKPAELGVRVSVGGRRAGRLVMRGATRLIGNGAGVPFPDAASPPSSVGEGGRQPQWTTTS
jgi:Sulfotransferase family